MSPKILGIAAQLELYSITTLYFSRESTRASIHRQPSATFKVATRVDNDRYEPSATDGGIDHRVDPIASQTVVNISYISIFLGAVLAVILAIFYLRVANEEASQTPYFRESVEIIGISCFLELCSEPFFAIVQQFMLYKTRATVETIASVAKSVVVCGTCIWASSIGWDAGVLPFALAYLLYSCVLFSGYVFIMARHSSEGRFSFFLKPITPGNETRYLANRFSKHLISFGASVYFQSIVKHLLTQGDSMILATVSSLEDQGIYNLVSNYAGLFARVVFQPVEESNRNVFARLLNYNGTPNFGSRGVETAKAHLVDILQAYGVLSVLTFSLGPALVPTILHVLIGSQWKSSKVDNLLSAYCYYLPFLAFNGITEAFVSSAASALEVRRQAVWMAAFSAFFTLVSFLQLREWGAYGLVWANILNMALRIVWSYFFIKMYLRQHENDLTISEIALNSHTYGICALTIGIMQVMHKAPGEELYDLAKRLFFSAACAILILYSEKELLLQYYSKIYQILRKPLNMGQVHR
jgi:oligosaccharide translocation protein RFT1